MKDTIKQIIESAISTLQQQGVLPTDITPNIQIDKSKDTRHGDYASNIALTLSKAAACKPRDLAEKIIAALPASASIDKVDIAGPGFINFFLTQDVAWQLLQDIHAQGDSFGRCEIGAGKKVMVEFVSANPTGPLHVGHGRNAAFGSAVANLLAAVGYDVQREYYVNDAGRQMDILATSIWLRYLAAIGEHMPFPVNGYQGDYVVAIAEDLKQQHGTAFHQPAADVMANLPRDYNKIDDTGDKEKYIDAVTQRAKLLLGDEAYQTIHQAGLNSILTGIKQDLIDFRVDIDEWFSERTLVNTGAVKKAVNILAEANLLYEKEGALWFRATDFDDDKDRVLIRDNGHNTYFASDVAYHLNKFDRGYEWLIDVWGADHHGYIPRVKAAIAALGKDPQQFSVMLVQFAILYRGKERVQMSSRSGSFVTLRELYQEIGVDAARFFYVMRKNEQHMDFDLELAKSKSNENPVYYIQYAHARICSVFKEAAQKGIEFDIAVAEKSLARLTEKHETALINHLSEYATTLTHAGQHCEPHLLAHYLRELANHFHSYYNAHKFLIDDVACRNARLYLIKACRQIMVNGLTLLAVSTPEEM